MSRERFGKISADLGEKDNLLVPMIHGAEEFDYAVARGGEKSEADVRRELGTAMHAVERLMSGMHYWINPEKWLIVYTEE